MTVSGSACKIAVTLAIGILKSAEMKKYAAATSASDRMPTSIQSRRDKATLNAPSQAAAMASVRLVKMPRRNTA